jgi:hypothetical protein
MTNRNPKKPRTNRRNVHVYVARDLRVEDPDYKRLAEKLVAEMMHEIEAGRYKPSSPSDEDHHHKAA